MKSKSIRKKIITNIAIVLLVNSVLIIAGISFATYKKMDKQKKHSLTEITIEKSQRISDELKKPLNLVEHLAVMPEIINWTEKPSPAAIDFLEKFNIKKEFSALYILDTSGTAIISTEPTFTNNNYSFRPYFKEALSDITNMYIAVGATSNVQGYYFATSIKKNGQIIGVMAIKLNPLNIYSLLESSPRDKEAHIMITDEYGVILYSDVKEREFHSLGKLTDSDFEKLKKENRYPNKEITPIQYQIAQEEIKKPIEEVKIYNFVDKEDDENELIAITQIGRYPLFLITEDNSWSFGVDAISLASISAGIIVFSKIAILLTLFWLISRNLKPIKVLEQMVISFGSGKIDIKNQVTSNDELQKLGEYFSQMANKLQRHHNDLENKINERTKELNLKNEYLNKTKVATLNILEDIQEEKNKTEELAKDLQKFKLALDNASDHIVITDKEGIVLYGNGGVEKITGYSLNEALGKKAGKLWAAPMSKEYYANLWDTIKTKKRTFDGEVQNKKKNGELYDAKITISPVLNNKNEVEFFIGIERDITHEKMVDKAKTEFVSLASHQLRTPLSSVNWYAEMLLAGDGGKLNEEQESFVKEIYTGNQRMVELVNSLLNVSRLELGTFAVDPEPTDVIKIAEDVLKELQPGIIQKQIKTNFEHQDGVPIIQADPKLFRIVFQNLLSNAVKYTPEKGKVSLKISKNLKNLLVEVSDTGYGIPKNEQDKIFQKLFRAENVREKDTEGTGLGLYIIKSIIDHAGGSIKFKSAEDKGTTFYLEIPLSGMKKKDGDKKIE
jgi:PAS domain S-box-containing protein